MSDAATPETAPAGWTDPTDAIMSLLETDTGADTDAAAGPQQPTSEVQAEDPYAGEEQSQAADPEPQREETTEPKFRVKVRGAEVEVPLPELLNGYSRTEDYKAKTAELAEQRRALETKQAEIAQRVQALDALAANAPLDPILAEADKTDWAKLAEENPAEYVRRRHQVDERVRAYQQVMAERQRVAMEAQQAQLERAQELLKQEIPEWADDAKRPALVRDVAETLRAYGFTDQELNGVADHRVIKVALDAARWRKASAARAAAEAQRTAPKPAAKVMSPGTGGNGVRDSNAARQLAQARVSGNTDQVIDAVLANLR